MKEFEELSLDEEELDNMRSVVFTELKIYCLQLFELLQNPMNVSSTIPAMLQLLRKSPPYCLQPLFDYALLPLLLLLDAAVESRSLNKKDSKEKTLMSDVLEKHHKVRDSVAEGVLQCLEELLKKCHLGSVDQMVVVLKKLTYAALLSPVEASEEFCEGVIKCFMALFLNLCPCSDDSCSCHQISGYPVLQENKDFQAQFCNSSVCSRPKECLLAFFQTQSASAAVGHWLSLFLKAADTEVTRGHRGSSKLRCQAFVILRILVAKVGTSDALAFFLPGVVSQFSKVLQTSKAVMSGAGGSTEAISQAIRGLAEYLMIVLQDDANLSSLDMAIDFASHKEANISKDTTSFLEKLRHLPVKVQGGSKIVKESSCSDMVKKLAPDSNLKAKMSTDIDKQIGSFYVNRTKEWIEETADRVDKLLGATFPHICAHPSKKVRLGLVFSIQGLLSRCSYTLQKSRLMLLECMCVFADDDSKEVSSFAQEFIEYLFLNRKEYLEQDIANIFVRLVEKLPKVVLGYEETYVLSLARQLLVVIYYSGPQLLMNHLLQSPVAAVRFLDMFSVCLSQSSVFAGSLDKLITARSSSVGFLQSVSELKGGTNAITACLSVMDSSPHEVSENISIQKEEIQYMLQKDPQQKQGNMQKIHELPRMPPWFTYIGSQKLYNALAGAVRLFGLALMADTTSEGTLSIIIDIPLSYLRKLISEIRAKECNEESWQSWYNRTGSGQLLRQASTAVCILNEMIFGISDSSVNSFVRTFRKRRKDLKVEQADQSSVGDQLYKYELSVESESVWKASRGAKSQLIDGVGRILHEYLSPEVWDLPTDYKSTAVHPDVEAEDISLHFLRDIAMLHQVIIDGIGIFNISMGKDFTSSGFLHSSLYLLLENLVSSSVEVRTAADAVLNVISTSSGHSTVGSLVLENADYVIDSICRQLRHLDLNPLVPNVLAAMLSYIGLAHEILPLLEEPIRHVSLELEILGRHQHPELTIPFLKAVAEIAKVSKTEANYLPEKASSYLMHVKSLILDDGKTSATESKEDNRGKEAEWEKILYKLNDNRRYRRTVGSISSSCLMAAMPLLASMDQTSCLVTMDVVEYGILALAKVEEAYKHEKETKEVMEEWFESHSYFQLKDALDAESEDSDENRLLPAMNKIWPFLVACIRNKNPVAIRRCSSLTSTAVRICGGDFFSRRFYTDGPHFWKLLTMSPFKRKPNVKQEGTPLLLPYRSTSASSELSFAEVSDLKVQAALLNMIADLSRNPRSASALEAVLKKVSGLVVGVACSGVTGLHDGSVNALTGLSCIDPDLIWLLMADIYYSMKKSAPPFPPTSDFLAISQILPPPLSPKDYLYAQYGGHSYGFDLNFSSVEIVFRKLNSHVFTNQMYS